MGRFARGLGLQLGHLLGPLKQRFLVVLALLSLVATAPWLLGRTAHGELDGLGRQLDTAGSLRYRLVALALALHAGEHLDMHALEREQEQAFEDLVEGDPDTGVPPCRGEMCGRLRSHADTWRHRIVPEAEAAFGGGAQAEAEARALVLAELRRLDDTVARMAEGAEERVDALESEGGLTTAFGLVLIAVVVLGVWDVFARIQRLASTTGAADPEQSIREQAAGNDEVAALADRLADNLAQLRKHHEADQQRILTLGREQRRTRAFAERLHGWLAGTTDLETVLAEAAAATGFEVAWLDGWKGDRRTLIGAIGLAPEVWTEWLGRVETHEGPDLLLAEQVPAPLRAAGIRTVLRITLDWDDERKGCLGFATREAERPSGERCAVARTLAHGFAVAGVGRELLAERERHARVAMLLAKMPSLADGVGALGAELRHVVPHDVTLLCLRAPDDGGSGTTWRLEEGGARQVVLRGCLASRLNDRSLPQHEHAALLGGTMASTCSVPLRAGDVTTGTLLLGRRSRGFTDGELRSLRAVAPVIATALARMQLEGQLHAREQVATLGGVTRMLAHEIRNPLNSMGMQIQLLERQLRRLDLDGQQDRALGRMELLRSEIRRLDHLVQDYLDLTRAGQWQCEPLDLRDVIHELGELHAAELEGAGIAMDVEVCARPAVVSANRDKIRQVLRNLVRNAIEAMEGAERRVLHVALREAAEGWTIHVRDTGPGLEAPDKAFLPSYTTKSSGTGMGLAISRRIAEQHGGRLFAVQASDEGAELVLALPERAAERAAQGDVPPLGAMLHRR